MLAWPGKVLESVFEWFEGAELAKVLKIRAGSVVFVRVNSRRSTLFAVPVPSGKGTGILFFAAKARSRGKIWWTPTLALAGAPLRRLIEYLEGLAEGGKPFSFKSKKSGLFVSVRRSGSSYALLLGKEKRVYVVIETKKGDLAKLARLLREAVEWRPADLPLPLTWRDKERIFGPYT